MAGFLRTASPKVSEFAALYASPVGKIILAADGCALTGVSIEGQKHFTDFISDQSAWQNNNPLLTAAKKWLDAYFAGDKPPIGDLPLAPAGSPFQQAVRDLLLEIPYGSCVAYSDIAGQIARQRGLAAMSAQAVGGAVGHNPIAIIIPCHRVIGKGGHLVGYAWGLELKSWLLRHEGHEISRNILKLE